MRKTGPLRALPLLLTLAVLSAAGCGRKTFPLIPDSPRPAAPADIKAVSRDATVFLTWPFPAKNIEGRPLAPADIALFRVDRAETGQEPAKKLRYRHFADIDTANPAPATIRSNVVTWVDDRAEAGRDYYYQISAISKRGGVSPWSEPVRVEPTMSLAIPRGLTATAGDSSVRLGWEAVSTRTDGSAAGSFVGYNVYRGSEAGRYSATPLNPEPLTVPRYEDATAKNDRTYYYIVRAVDNAGPGGHESLDSAPAIATPRDMTPPAPPTGLSAVPGVKRVFLTWNESPEKDLAGYYVYRADRKHREFARLTATPLQHTTFSDDTVTSGASYWYAVTAVDEAGNESSRSEEKKAFVERFR